MVSRAVRNTPNREESVLGRAWVPPRGVTSRTVLLCRAVLSARLGTGKGGLRMAPEDALQAVLQVRASNTATHTHKHKRP